jgi:hypothetical protein
MPCRIELGRSGRVGSGKNKDTGTINRDKIGEKELLCGIAKKYGGSNSAQYPVGNY